MTQAVHKVSLQFRIFITMANEKTDKWRLLQNETCMFKLFPLTLVARSASRRYSISYTIDVSLRCSWSFIPPFIEHCLCHHKFLVPCTNWWSWRWISSILSSEVSPSLQIRFSFNKQWYTLCLLLRSSHFVRSFNSILFINRVPEMQCDRNLDNHWVHETNLTTIPRQLPL